MSKLASVLVWQGYGKRGTGVSSTGSSMPPRRWEQQLDQVLHELEATSCRLDTLLQSPAACLVLQQPPPAADPTPDQNGLI